MSSSVRASSFIRYLPWMRSGRSVPSATSSITASVEAGRHQVDHLHAGGELGVLATRDLAGHEDAEMADRLMQRVSDGLAVGHELVLVAVEIRDQPSACCGGVMSSPQEHNTMIAT